MKTRTQQASAKHEALYQEVVAVIRKYADEMDKAEILAVFATLTGKVLAMQDQRKYTVEAGLAIISKNIEAGNQSVIDNLHKSEGFA